MYKHINGGGILRTIDSACMPADPANSDYAQYLAWLAEGNTPEPADVPHPNVAILAQIRALEVDSILNRGSREKDLFDLRTAADEYSTKLGVPAALLLASNTYYNKLVALDAQAAALRSQLT